MTNENRRIKLNWLGRASHLSGFILFPLLIALAVVLYIVDIGKTYEPHLLLPILNTIFTAGSGLIIAFFSIRTYISTSTRRVLFLGGGALAFGLSSLLAGWMFPDNLNTAVTVFNFGVLLAAMLHFSGAIQNPAKSRILNPAKKLSNRVTTILFSSGIALFFILISIAVSGGLFPDFFVPGVGYTPIRYVFSAMYVVLFVVSALLYARMYLFSKAMFVYWYSLGLAIIAVGLIAAWLGTPGDPLNWLGRIAQYIGSVYFIVAVVITRNEARNKQVGVSELIAQHLSRSKVNYELLINAASDAIMAVDGTGRILMWNPAAEKMFGYRQNEILGSPFFNLISSLEQIASYTRTADKAAPDSNDPGPSMIESRARRRTGEEFPVELTLVSKRQVAGWLPTTTTTTLIVRDITGRKKTESALRGSEEKYRSLFSNMTEGFQLGEIILDAEGKPIDYIFLEVNPSFEKMSGLFHQKIIDKRVKDVMPGIDPFWIETFGKVALTGQPVHVERYVPIARKWLGVYSYCHQPGRFAALWQDITDRKQAEEAFRAKDAELELIVNHTPFLLTRCSRDLYYRYVSNAYAAMIGRTPNEIAGKPIIEIMGEKGFETIRPYVETVLQGQPVEYEHEVDFVGVGPRQLRVHYTPERDGEGQVVGWIASIVDISARKQAEEALKESEERFSKAFHSSPTAQGISYLAGGTVLDVNESFERLLGFSRQELTGHSSFELNVFVDPNQRLEMGRAILQGEKIQNKEMTIRTKEGKLLSILLSSEIIQIRHEKMLLTTLVNITERKKAEEAVKKSEERFRSVLDTSRDVIYRFNLQTARYEYISPSSEAIVGYSPSELMALDSRASIDLVYPDDLPALREAQVDAEETGEAEAVYRQRTKNGGYRWLSNHMSLIKDGAGRPLYRSGNIRDITENKQTEESQQKYARDLEAANKELEAFNYSVTHDLKQPLRALGSFSDLLFEDYKDKLDETGRDYLNRIHKASHFISELTDDMLKLSRITRTDMFKDPVNLSDIAQSILDELLANQPERQADIKIAPGIMAVGDNHLLTIALRNLLENAWKFTLKCEITQIEFGTMETGGDRVYVIRDNGIGFDMRYQDKLFQPFQRLTTDKNYPGTGIGLAIVQRVILRHGGKIWAEGEIGKGATFYFTLI